MSVGLDIFAIAQILVVQTLRDSCEFTLFIGNGCPFKDTVVAAANVSVLICREMYILSDLLVIDLKGTGNALHDRKHLSQGEMLGCFRDDVTHTVTDQNLDSNLRVVSLCVSEVD